MRRRFTRREIMAGAMKTAVAASVLPSMASPATGSAARCVNIVNFIRAEEPREPCDLFQPVQEQMALIRKYRFPATWLLQYDALVEGPFVEFLKIRRTGVRRFLHRPQDRSRRPETVRGPTAAVEIARRLQESRFSATPLAAK